MGVLSYRKLKAILDPELSNDTKLDVPKCVSVATIHLKVTEIA